MKRDRHNGIQWGRVLRRSAALVMVTAALWALLAAAGAGAAAEAFRALGEDGGFVSEEPEAPQQGSATVQVALPDNTDMAHVVISVDGVVQHDETHDTSLGSISVPLTGTVGEHEVTVSVDGSNSTSTYTFS